ncbi:MAG: serine/threonine-protein kinase, partial [Myxococcota bacterium]
VCQAIYFAHRRGVVHRDLKPENVMVGDAGEVYVLDWGVARVSGAVGDDDLDSDLHDIHILKEEGSQPYTRLGDLLGTPSYMSPEQLMGSTASERSDVYALGIILFEILTGRPLRPRGTTLAQLRDEASRPVLAPSFVAPHRDIPPELEEVCLSAMTLAPSERPTAQGLNEAIEAFLDGDRDMNLRRRRAQTHLEQAQARWQAAQDNDDEDQRTEAGRLVLQALSLDPDSQDARQLLVSVLTTPPQKLPVEAQQIIDDENLLLVKRQARGWFFFYATWLVTVPFVLFLVDVWEVWSFGLLLFALLWSLIGTGVMMWTRHVMPGLYASVAGALVACLAISRIVGPLILFPTLVLMAYSANILYPAAHHRRFVGIGCVTTFLAGMALELWGPSPCYVWLEDRLIVMPHMFGVNTDWSMMLVVSFLASACGLMGLMSARASKFIDEARAQIHRQTWQLQQLLPGEVATDRTTSNPSSERR